MDIREDAHRLLDELVRQRRPLDNEPHHESEPQRAADIEDGLALLRSGDLDHPDRDSA